MEGQNAKMNDEVCEVMRLIEQDLVESRRVFVRSCPSLGKKQQLVRKLATQQVNQDACSDKINN